MGCDCKHTCGRRFIGKVLKGYCDGWFGRDGYGDKTIEAVGSDWVVVRYDEDSTFGNHPSIAIFDTEEDLVVLIEKWLKEED